MRAQTYKFVLPVEVVTATSAGVALDLDYPVHLVTTDGDEGLDAVTVAAGTVIGERHYIALVELAHVNDSLRVIPANRPDGDDIRWHGTKAGGLSVELLWNGVVWNIIGGNGEPYWHTIV